MNFVVAIPSYLRSKKLRSHTLDFLSSEKIDPQSITVFVASEEEKHIYEKTLLPDSYGSIVVGVLGLAEQRNFIHSYYPIDTQILFIDDDIKNLKWINKKPLIQFVNRMFEIAREEKINLWSIQPASTVFYCKDRIAIGKQFCVGCFYGQINTIDSQIPLYSACEDKYRSLYRWKTDGATMRYDGCCPNTTYFTKGGMTEYRKNRQHADQEAVIALFPKDCFLKVKKNDIWDCCWKPIRTKDRTLN